jgi:hypothetical protein
VTGIGHDLLVLWGRDKALFGFIEITLIFKRQGFSLPVLEFDMGSKCLSGSALTILPPPAAKQVIDKASMETKRLIALKQDM